MNKACKSTLGRLSVAVLIALLYACGGSDGGTPPPDNPGTTNLIPVALPQTISRILSSSTTGNFPNLPITLSATDSDGSIQSYRITTQPTHSQMLVPSGAMGNEVMFEPLASFTGEDQFEFVAMDNMGATSPPALVSISLMIRPAATAQDITIQPQASVVITLAGVDADGTIAGYIISEQPKQGTLVAVPSSAAGWRYTQNAGFTGTDTFRFTVTDNDGLESEPAVVMVGQPRLIRSAPDFRSFQGYQSANPQVRIINTDTYAEALGERSSSNLACEETPAGSGMYACHGDRTTQTFITNLGVAEGGDIYHYYRSFEDRVAYSVNGRSNINTNINTIIGALETVDRNIIYWTALDSSSISSPSDNLVFEGQSFERWLVDAATYIAEQNVFMVLSMENTSTKTTQGLAKEPLFCDNDPGLCGELVDLIIKGPAELTDKLKEISIFAGAITDQSGLDVASGAAQENGEIEENAIYAQDVSSTSHASAKLGAIAARVAAALRTGMGRTPTAQEIKAGLLSRTEMRPVSYDEGGADSVGTVILRTRTIRVLTNESF